MTALLRLIFLSLVLVLTACGGSSGGGSTPVEEPPGGDGPGDGEPGDDDPTEPGDAEALTGRATKGILRNASIEASVWAGTGWASLGTAETGDDGEFGLDIVPQNAPVRIVATATGSTTMRCDAPSGCGGAAFGDFVPVPSGLTLTTLVPGDALVEDGHVAITPLTHLAARWAQDMPQGISNAGAELALNRVAALFDLAEDFAVQWPVDLGDADEVAAADDAALRQALLSAAFLQLAETQDVPLPTLLAGAGSVFSLFGGQLITLSGGFTMDELAQQLALLDLDLEAVLADLDLELDLDDVNLPGLDSLVNAATAVAAHLDTEGSLDDVIASLDALMTPWQTRPLTTVAGTARYDSADFDSGLVPLDDYDLYRTLALDAADGVSAELRGLGWLYRDEAARDDTEGMLNVLAEALGFALDAAICVPQRKNAQSCDVAPPYATLVQTSGVGNFWTNGYLRLQGTRFGQAVDMQISANDIRDLLRQGEMPITLDGTITSGTSVTSLDVRLDMDITDNDLSGFQALSNTAFGNEALLNPLLDDLAADLSLALTFSGAGNITSTDSEVGSYSFTGLDSGLTFNRRVLTQDESGPLMTLLLAAGSRTNPAGETLFSLPGDDAFSLILDDPLALHIEYGTERLGLPEMQVLLAGTLEGYTPLLDALGDYITALLDEDVAVPEFDLDEWLGDIDLTLLAAAGTAELKILDQTHGEKHYRFTSDADGLHISAPDSLDTALTLRLSGLAGYLYAGESLIGTVHAGNAEDGLLINLLDASQRSYLPVETDRAEVLSNLYLLLEGLFGGLFDTE
ncbi:MAG: hypothetical protein LAT61_03905 [Alcanivorax sp.]|nr:hypothetical protein [Alcanivorax sp.]